MHERLVYGLFTPFPAVLIPASYVFVKAFFPWYSQTSQAAGARRAVRSRPGSAQSPRPPLSTALTVSIKAQQPVDKLARSAGAGCGAGCGVGEGGSRWAVCGPRRERAGHQVAAPTTRAPSGGAGGAGGGRGSEPAIHCLRLGRTALCTRPTTSA